MGTDGLPVEASSAGHAITSKSSPIGESVICGIVQRPVSWIAVNSLMNAPGSNQSVGAPSRSESLSKSSCNFVIAAYTGSVSKPNWPSSVR